MESKIAKALNMKLNPVATIWSEERPEKALHFKEGKWGCIMWLFAGVAKGNTAVFDRATYGCWGGGVGLGFGNLYEKFPGGTECFYYFLSTGNKNFDMGRKVAEQMKGYVTEEFLDEFLEGERYTKTPEDTKNFVEQLPIIDIPAKYVILKPFKGCQSRKRKSCSNYFSCYTSSTLCVGDTCKLWKKKF